MLCVVGDLVEDVVVRLAGPVRGGTDTAAIIERRPGGSAASVARSAAQHGAVRFIGRVGDDAVGGALVAGLERDGVDARVQRAGRTGTIIVLVDESGERSMLTDRGASTDLVDVPDDWLGGVDVLHLPSYSLFAEPIGSTCERLAERVHRAGGRLSIDASSTGLLTDVGVGAALQRIGDMRPDVLFANAAEAELLDLGRWRGPLVVKRGPAPVEVVESGRPCLVPVPPVAAGTDTTGAGDVLAGACLAAWAAGAGLVAAVEAGVDAATRLLRSRVPMGGAP